MIKVIIFDYDGVIVDSFPTVHEVYQIICKRLGKDCPSSLNKFKKVYGYHSRELLKNLNFTQEEINKVDRIYRKEILNHIPPLFPGIVDVIMQLHKNYKLIVMSSSPKHDVIKKLEHFSLLKFFNYVLGSEKLGPIRKARPLAGLIRSFGINKDEVLVIGDRIQDYNSAKEAGLNNVVLVEYGWGYDKKEIPDYKSKLLVKKPLDLLNAVKKF